MRNIKQIEPKDGQIVYTPNAIFGSGGEKHNIVEFDKRINYAEAFGKSPRWYKVNDIIDLLRDELNELEL